MSTDTTTQHLAAPRVDAKCITQITELKECGCITAEPQPAKKAHVFLQLSANITGKGSRANLTHLTTVMRIDGKFSGVVLPKHAMVELWVPVPKRAQTDELIANTTGYAYLCLRNVTDGMEAHPPHEPACADHRADLAPAMRPRDILQFIVTAEPRKRPERYDG